MTNAVYKTQAKRLAEHLSRVHGVKLKQASMLEAVASLHGRPDWNTLLACGPNEGAVAGESLAAQAALAPGVKLVTETAALHQSWVQMAIKTKSKANSLYIHPTHAGCTVCIRVDGRRRLLFAANRAEYEAVRASLYQAAGLEEGHKSQSAKFSGVGELEDFKFSLQTVVTSSGAPSDAYLALSWQPVRMQYPDLEKLELSTLAEWKHGISQTSGLCLVAGPTSSGKTTTVAATAKALVKEGRLVHVSTNEIAESGLPGASFERGVREPGDVAIMGELRTSDDLESALRLVEYGLLVIAEVHGRDSQSALERLRAMGASESQLNASLNIVMAQHLVARVCSVCMTADGEACATGCDSCYEGYRGTIVLSEALVAYPGRKITERTTRKEGGGYALYTAAASAVKNKLTTNHELARVFGPDVIR